jgi:hypothetical protein
VLTLLAGVQSGLRSATLRPGGASAPSGRFAQQMRETSSALVHARVISIRVLQQQHKMSKKPAAEVPQEFMDPISMRIFVDPVVTEYGHTYSRGPLLQWWASSGRCTCPNTNQDLRDRTLRPNVQLRQVMQEFFEQHPEIDRENYEFPEKPKEACVSWMQFFVGTAVFAVGYLLGSNRKPAIEDSRRAEAASAASADANAARALQQGFGS